jgi:hypothetical protein
MRRFCKRRKGVSTMIGGIIILTLFLSALSVMVFISQQYDTYQSTVETMNRKDIDAFSENLSPVFPGLLNDTAATSSYCIPNCYSYDLLISNEAAIGTQVSRIYVNSTDPRPYVSGQQGPSIGCTNLCTFDSADVPQPFHFLASSAFVNPSEYQHRVIFYTNSTYTLPYASGIYGLNSIALVTARGRMFSFQWPMPPTGVGTTSYLATHILQVAYQGSGNPGFASSNEPGAVAKGSGGSSAGGYYCHGESNVTSVPAGSYGTLWFVNPWVSLTIFNDAFPYTSSNHTSFFVSVSVTNNQQNAITLTSGNMWLQLTVPDTNHGPTPGLLRVLVMGGPLVGTYYDGAWTPAGSATTVASATSVLLIYRINIWSWAGSGWTNPSGVTYSGMATVTNSEEGSAYFEGTTLLDGLYVRTSC